MSEPLTQRKCEIDGCDNPAGLGGALCDEHQLSAFVTRALEIDPATLPTGCLHPASCKARAHYPGGPITPDFRHCEACRG